MRRIGSTTAERGSTGYTKRPDVFELGDGSFLVIGKVPAAGQAPTAEQRRAMGASIGANERTVILPCDKGCKIASDSARPLPRAVEARFQVTVLSSISPSTTPKL
ncbi:hypothetical protein [Streptomyces colonosanans]|uniref:Uncharacterized protein n=1 Tax=Streptomyces colonosanans TaxID=1428652 RepID=A0A1S2Q317_9ACTN|nr:hypothetical protein [Streptomyces colonosanans]OIK00031.1 hypothetical protein BIV24_03130 [Streptomyces colonosanans]